MFSFLASATLVVLHTGQSVTLVEYLFRVLVFLLAFAGLGVTLFWTIRVAGIVPSTGGRDGGRTEDER